ncbi:MAG: hypothetical protein IV101_18990 [Dechloromonas sp.]|uniref:alpha-glutamyl/putrescinyl thymine pyrophosphorylase clade 3 protein n=1 Tax=Dechloromonas sp. TaxID=1917218 RepID=UPI0027E9706B|nr:hypothetical protein [Dechloromonas sp.]MBT9522966.1 hypothetical protein [Dechloromonas sp.]
MRAREAGCIERLRDGLQECEANYFALPGVLHLGAREVYIGQLVDSMRRIRFVHTLLERDIHPSRADGLSEMFDPLKAAALRKAEGNIDEACWLVFLFVHFGKHLVSGYRYAREVYGALGTRAPWTFSEASADTEGFRSWLHQHEAQICRGARRGFGNHRKYQSLSAYRPNGTGDAVESYVRWVGEYGSHAVLFENSIEDALNDPEVAFDRLYRSMNSVTSFGRTAKFDYLTMIGKLGLADIRPGSAYFSSATGPVVGARLMLQGNTSKGFSIAELDQRIHKLGEILGVGMQEMEDSLCNWQKSPTTYINFRG